MSLSDKREPDYDIGRCYYLEKDIKQAIQDLKDFITSSQWIDKLTIRHDEIFGEELTK